MNNELKLSDIFSETWKLTKEHWGFLVGYLIIFFLISSFLQFAQNRIFNNGFIATIIYFASAIIALFMQMGFLKSALLITSGIKPGFEQLYVNSHHFIAWIVAQFIFVIIVTLGFIFFIFPGFYLLARFSLYPLFILDKNMGPLEALKGAKVVSKGQCWFLFLLFLCTFLINILGCLFFGVGLLITIPISALAWALTYRKLTKNEPDILM